MDTARAMSQQNVELIKEMYAAFQAGDFDRALGSLDSRVVIDATARVDGGIGHGPEGFVEVIGPWLAAFDNWSEEVEEYRDLGDAVCVVATQSRRVKDTGMEIRARAVIYEVAGGAVTRMTLYNDPEEALSARGS